MKLVFVSGPAAGNRYKVEGRITAGRDESNDIVIVDPSVSLVHCEISSDEQGGWIKDLGSTNGIKLNGQRVIHSRVEHGDTIAIGKNIVHIELPDEARRTSVLSSKATTVVVPPRQRTEEDEVRELSANIFGEVLYYFKRKIADGGMGSVYEAEQFGAEGFIKKVAIKTILPVYVKKPRFVSSFIGEAKLVANLVHQNIVQIHHLGRHENGYYISMEFIDGVNLTDFIYNHKLMKTLPPVDVATFIVSRLCRGLEYAHSKRDDSGKPLGLVHRDVSPSNVMITREGEVKLTDFGVAKAARFMEDDETYLVGSVEYMSPEQAACDSVDGRSDLFSLGLVYFELLTGCRVFQCYDDNIDHTLEQVKSASIPDPRLYRDDIPESVLMILMKCLEKKVENRYQSATDLGEALEREMYSKGLGPTIVTLARYIEEMQQKLPNSRRTTKRQVTA